MLKKKPNSNIGDREAFFSPRFFIFSGGICSANLPSSHTKDERKRLLLLQRWIGIADNPFKTITGFF